MHTKSKLFYNVSIISVLMMLAGCVHFHCGYVRISGISDRELVFERVNKLLENAQFVKLGCTGEATTFEHSCYHFETVGLYEGNNVTLKFDASVWNDFETNEVVLIFCQQAGNKFSKTGKVIFTQFIDELQTNFSEWNVTFGEEDLEGEALHKKFYGGG